MPNRDIVCGASFDPKTIDVLTAALDAACRTLDDCDPAMRKRLAALACAECGERDLHKLAFFALEGIDKPVNLTSEEV